MVSKESQQLLVDIDRTEIFELCENSAKLQCPDCNSFYGNRDYLLQLREKFEVQAESYNTPEDQLLLCSNPWLCHKEEFQSRTKHGVSERQVMFYKANQMLKKARQKQTWQPSDEYFQGGTNKKDPESHWRSTILAKRKSCFSIASLLKDTTFQLRDVSGRRTPDIGFFV